MFGTEKIRQWLNPGRIIPLLTAISVFAGNILGLLGVIQISVVEGLILLAIGLLAIDALTERIQILSRIEIALQRIQRPKSTSEDFLISSYSQIRPLSERLLTARQLWVSGTNLVHLLTHHEEILIECITQRGLEVKFLIASPESPFIGEMAIMNYPESSNPLEIFTVSMNKTSVQLRELIKKSPTTQIEIRYLTHYPLQSLLIIDGGLPDGEIQVNLYKHTRTPIAVFLLESPSATQWYRVFLDEFLYLWNSATDLPTADKD
jgi:hypothetical protein